MFYPKSSRNAKWVQILLNEYFSFFVLGLLIMHKLFSIDAQNFTAKSRKKILRTQVHENENATSESMSTHCNVQKMHCELWCSTYHTLVFTFSLTQYGLACFCSAAWIANKALSFFILDFFGLFLHRVGSSLPRRY